MKPILFDDNSWDNLLPLTFTRPVSEIRIGILTIKEKWEKMLNTTCSYLTQTYLQKKYPLESEQQNLLINSSVCPNNNLIDEIKKLQPGETLVNKDIILAVNLTEQEVKDFSLGLYKPAIKKEFLHNFLKINFPWDIFRNNGAAIEFDFKLITQNRKSQPISSTNRIAGEENIFLEEGAKIEFSIINASEGFVYLGADAEIMEGSIVRGSLALCEHSALKLGAKIYGPTTIGPHSKVGGEVNNSVIFGYSNKAHDGFLGNSVLGEWCNLGADTNNSNLKNNYEEVKVWNYVKEQFMRTGLQFCGLIMGDHSKSGINTMFNTGTVVGVSANIYGAGFPRNFLPSFSWGGPQGMMVYQINKAFETARKVMERRNIPLTDVDKEILEHIFNATQKYRNF